jgi:hypothetical protein
VAWEKRESPDASLPRRTQSCKVLERTRINKSFNRARGLCGRAGSAERRKSATVRAQSHRRTPAEAGIRARGAEVNEVPTKTRRRERVPAARLHVSRRMQRPSSRCAHPPYFRTSVPRTHVLLPKRSALRRLDDDELHVVPPPAHAGALSWRDEARTLCAPLATCDHLPRQSRTWTCRRLGTRKQSPSPRWFGGRDGASLRSAGVGAHRGRGSATPACGAPRSARRSRSPRRSPAGSGRRGACGSRGRRARGPGPAARPASPGWCSRRCRAARGRGC